MPTSPRPARNSRRFSLLLGNRVFARTADVSTGGFSVEAPFVFMPGSLLHGTFDVGGCKLPFRGEVVWARPAGQPQAPNRMGVRLTEFPSEAQWLLGG
ncbi:MAG: PilZ domain-containing protein [Hyalangium sp.]|uniref:PilZ domain-containing protein n=1 Tax=Hyalangium sp. TaxID=2028555 RepID=UPI003899DA6C